jgi:hypothetical protein
MGRGGKKPEGKEGRAHGGLSVGVRLAAEAENRGRLRGQGALAKGFAAPERECVL